MSTTPKKVDILGPIRERQKEAKEIYLNPQSQSKSKQNEAGWDVKWDLLSSTSDDETPTLDLKEEEKKKPFPDPDIIFAESSVESCFNVEGVSTTLVPSDTSDTDPTWKWRKRYGDSCDCEYLEGKWEEVNSKYNPGSDHSNFCIL